MGKYFDAYVKQMQDKKKKYALTSEQKVQKFKASYKEPYSFGSKLSSDLGSFMTALPRIPGALWKMFVQDPAYSAASIERGGFWDPNKSFMEQWKNQATSQQVGTAFKNLFKQMAVPYAYDIITGLPYTEKIAPLQALKEKVGLPQGGLASQTANKAILESMIKGTGKWVYDPESKTRKWFSGSRVADYKERPFSTALEDIVNVSIVGAPIFKALGLGGKLVATAPVQAIKAAKFGEGLITTGKAVGEAKRFIPNKVTQFLGNQFARFKLQQEFNTLMKAYEQNTFQGTENILQPGFKKLAKMGADLPIEAQQHLFKILEGTELYNESLIARTYTDAIANNITKLKYIDYKNNFDTALNYITTKSIKETNYLVKRGILTTEQAKLRAFTPAVKKYLVNSGRYTMKELDDILIKENGWGKSLADEFDLAVTEMYKYSEELGQQGWHKPVYMPHQFDHYAKASDFFKQQPLYKKTPAFLKKTKGVSGYIDEPYTVWTRHDMQKLKWQLTEKLVNKIVDRYGMPLTGGETVTTGYKIYYPEGFLKDMFSKNKKFAGNTKVQIPGFMADELNKMFNAPGAIENFMRATYDPLTKVWKTSVLGLSPRWLFNNFVGNIALNTLGGVVNPLSYMQAFKKMNQARKIAKETGITEGRAMAKVGIRKGVTDMGIYAGEARQAASGIARVAETAPVQSMFGKALNYTGLPQIAKGMFRVNKNIENFYRTAHYIDKAGKGFSPAKALASVNEFLFDYSAMSSIEKTFIKRVIPFWAWQKNITRLVATYPFRHPTGMAVLQKLSKITQEVQDDEAEEKGTTIENKFLPDWFKSYIETPLKSGKENLFLSTRGLNPFADVGMLAGGWKSYLSSINPLLKIPLERATGQSFYKEGDFTSPFKNQYSSSNEKVLPSWWRHVMSNFPQFTMIENLVRPYAKYDTGEPILDEKGRPKYLKSKLLTVLKMFGINLSPYDVDNLTQQEAEKIMMELTKKKGYQKRFDLFKARQ